MTRSAPVPGHSEVSAVGFGVGVAMPLPAFVWFSYLDKTPELKKAASVVLVNLVNVQAEAPFCQCAYTANTSMAVVVPRDASVSRAK